MNTLRNALILGILSGASACSSGGDAVDIGESRTGQKLEDYAAVWDGYAEAHDFADGSDRVRLTLDAEGNGTLQIGDSPALPVATNPDEGYPANLDLTNFFEIRDKIAELSAGVSYPVQGATVEAARVQLSVNPWYLESDWCALQTSYPLASSETGYACLPGDGSKQYAEGCTYYDGEIEVPASCALIAMCKPHFGVCACDATSCSEYEPPAEDRARIDASLQDSGNALVGTLKLGQGPGVTIRLTRAGN